MIQNMVFIHHLLTTSEEVLYYFLCNPQAIYITLVQD